MILLEVNLDKSKARLKMQGENTDVLQEMMIGIFDIMIADVERTMGKKYSKALAIAIRNELEKLDGKSKE